MKTVIVFRVPRSKVHFRDQMIILLTGFKTVSETTFPSFPNFHKFYISCLSCLFVIIFFVKNNYFCQNSLFVAMEFVFESGEQDRCVPKS